MFDPYRLVDELRSEGLHVRLFAHWAGIGGSWRLTRPAGVMVHHTAAPVPYPLRDLAGIDTGRIKCNMNVKQDGTIWLIAYGACNYSSGPGSSVVLDELLDGTVPTANARERALPDDIGGNSYFWNIEVDHRGDGSPIPQIVETATAAACTVVARHFGFDVDAVISHAEWTARKVDPFWNGHPRAAIEKLRVLIEKGEQMRGPNGEPHWEYVSSWARGAWSWAWEQPRLLSDDDPATPHDESSNPQDTVTKEQLMAHLERFERRLEDRLEQLLTQTTIPAD